MTMLRSPARGSFNDWIATLSGPTFVTFVGCLLSAAIVVCVLVMMFLRIPIDAGSLAVIEALAAGCLGGGYLGYKTKRSTWRPDLTIVRPGSDPNDPLVRSLGGTEYHVHAPAYLDKPEPRNATAVPVVSDDDAPPPA